jgi:hypothetical protein
MLIETAAEKELRVMRGIKLNGEVEPLKATAVERLFAPILKGDRGLRFNPVTGGAFVWPDDPIREQIDDAWVELGLREYFRLTGPREVPELPIGVTYENIKYPSREGFMVAFFQRMLVQWQRDHGGTLAGHPDFGAFARHLMCCEWTPVVVREDAAMLQKYPPQRIPRFRSYLDECAEAAARHQQKGKSQSEPRLRATVTLAPTEAAVIVSAQQSLVGVQNGVVDLRNQQFRPPRRQCDEYLRRTKKVA